jgi:mono/diheme cytochrome c family protein
MRALARRVVVCAVGGWLLAGAGTAPEAADLQVQTPAGSPAPVVEPEALFTRYCLACHNTRLQTGGLAIDLLDTSNVSADAAGWERVLRRLRTRSMPPQGMPRPDDAAYGGVVDWLEAGLDTAAAARPDAGRPLLRRLNRTEYANAIRDLLALDIDPASLLPPDNSAHGFDNIADVLGFSPVLQERYLSAADRISALAVGDLELGPEAHTYRVRQDLSQDQHIEGLPLGTVGGSLIHHTFPADGEYELSVRLFRTNFGMMRGLEHPRLFTMTIDGRRVHAATVGGDADLGAAFEAPVETADAVDARLSVRVRVAAGPRAIGLAFVENAPVLDTVRLQPFLRSSANTLDWTGRPHVDSLLVSGPFDPSGPGDTPSRRRIFVCRPDSPEAEAPCAREIIATLARRAFRQPVSEADLQPLLRFYEEGRREGFEVGVQRTLQLILASPQFVLRIERDPDHVAPGAMYRIGDIELATRLSFFLWSSIPDDELLRLAGDGALSRPRVLEQQVRRMLADPRARALVEHFAGQWLRLRNVRSLRPNSDEFPDFDDNLRQAFLRETELFIDSIIREDRTVLDLLDADYTFVNGRLARHYGLPNIYGSHFRRVPVTDEARRGLLGHGSVLAVTSYANRTSPVLRGQWILENILGTPPPPPPPDVPALEEEEGARRSTTVRERLAQHRANPACATCHNVMDPLGFALEHFDAVGAWRTQEAGVPIDASGELADGTVVDGVVSLREALLKRPEVFVSTLVEKLMIYALGRGLDHRDMPAVRAIVRDAAPEYRFSSLVSGIVNSVPFQMRMKPAVDADPAALALAVSH